MIPMNKFAIPFVAAALTLSAPIFAAELGASVGVDTSGVTNAAQQTVDTTKGAASDTVKSAQHKVKKHAQKAKADAKASADKVNVEAEDAATAKVDAEAAKADASANVNIKK
jgi:gas vesicle protein